MENLFVKLFTFLGGLAAAFLDSVNSSFLELMGLSGKETLALFFGIFPVTKDFADIFMALGLLIVFIITAINISKSMFSMFAVESQNPIYVMMRAILIAGLVANSHNITAAMVGISTKPYEIMMGVGVEHEDHLADMGTKIFDPDEGVVKVIREPQDNINVTLTGADVAAGVGFGAGMFAGAGVMFMVLNVLLLITFSYVKLLLEIVERYIILALLIIMAPLCIATGVSSSTKHVFDGWLSMMISQIIIMMMSVFFLQVFANGVAQVMHNLGIVHFNGYIIENEKIATALTGVEGLILGMLMLFAWLRTGQRIDSHMSTLGLRTAQAGGGLGAELFGGLRMASRMTLPLTNAAYGTNHKTGGELLAKESMGALKSLKNNLGLGGKKGDDEMIGSLLNKGNRDRALSRGEKRRAKNLLKKGNSLSGKGTLDLANNKGSKINSHKAVAGGIKKAMGDFVPDNFKGVYGSIDGEKGEMSGRFENENGDEVDVTFSKEKQSESDVAVEDENGDLWYATVQGSGSSEFLTGNENSLSEAEGTDLAEFAGGEEAIDMQEAGPGEVEGEFGPEGEVEAPPFGTHAETADGDFADISDDATLMAEDVDGELHDVSDMMTPDGEMIGGTVGSLDENGEFVEDPDGDFVMNDDGDVFAMEDGMIEDAGMYLNDFDAESVDFSEGGVGYAELSDGSSVAVGEDGRLDSFNVDANGLKVGGGAGANSDITSQLAMKDVNGESFDLGPNSFDTEGSMKTFAPQLDENGNYMYDDAGGQMFEEVPNGAGSHVQDANGNFHEVGFGSLGVAPTQSGIELGKDSFDSNGFVKTFNGSGELGSGKEVFNEAKDGNGEYFMDKDGNFHEVPSGGMDMGLQTTASGLQAGDVVKDFGGEAFTLGSQSFNENGELATYEPLRENNGELMYDDHGNMMFSETEGGKYLQDANGNFQNMGQSITPDTQMEKGFVPSGGVAEVPTNSLSAGDTVVNDSGQSFSLGEQSFNDQGQVQTFAPIIDSNGTPVFDNDGNLEFSASDQGTYVMDSDGNFQNLGSVASEGYANAIAPDQGVAPYATATDDGTMSLSVSDTPPMTSGFTPKLEAGSTMRNDSGESFTLGAQSFNEQGQVQRYDNVGGEYVPSSTGSYIKDSNDSYQSMPNVPEKTFNFGQSTTGTMGDHVKVESGATFTNGNGEGFAQIAPSTVAQRYDKTETGGFVPSSTGNYVQTSDPDGKAQFTPMASEGVADNGAMLRYSKDGDGNFVRDNAGDYAMVQNSQGESQYAPIADASLKQTSTPQRYSYDTSSQSYIPDPKGDSVMTMDSSGNTQYSKLSSDSMKGGNLKTYNKEIAGGGLNIGIKPAPGVELSTNYVPTGSQTAGNAVLGKNGKYYELASTGGKTSDGAVQTYSKNPASGKYVPDPNGEFAKVQSPGASTPSYVKTGKQPETYAAQYNMGTARVNANGGVSIGPKDKMVNNKDGTIDLQFADGRTAKLSSTNMYTPSKDDPTLAGTVKFGNGEYFYQDTSPTYASLGGNLRKGQEYKGQEVQGLFRGVKQFQRTSTFGSGDFTSVKKAENLSMNDIKEGKIAAYVKEGNSHRLATKQEINNNNVEKYVQNKLGQFDQYVQARGFDSNNRMREAYVTETNLEKVKVGNDGNVYAFGNKKPGGKQDVYRLVSKGSGLKPKKYDEVKIGGREYYVTKKEVDYGSELKRNFDRDEVQRTQKMQTMKTKKGIDTTKRPRQIYQQRASEFVK